MATQTLHNYMYNSTVGKTRSGIIELSKFLRLSDTRERVTVAEIQMALRGDVII